MLNTIFYLSQKLMRRGYFLSVSMILPVWMFCQADRHEESIQEKIDMHDSNKMDGDGAILLFHLPMQDMEQSPTYGSTRHKYSGPLTFAWPHTVAPMAV